MEISIISLDAGSDSDSDSDHVHLGVWNIVDGQLGDQAGNLRRESSRQRLFPGSVARTLSGNRANPLRGPPGAYECPESGRFHSHHLDEDPIYAHMHRWPLDQQITNSHVPGLKTDYRHYSN